ncbi:uracil-DNA glycosylase family protein [Vagococcus fluvialis]|uniref:uracil-DNA glycosylase family protein n=1 Tax=Vagococcus fluvialis TaxID=2738 RepID=UPI001A8D2684|nr:uracil-DNA glycosylase family protein [Vagococcus fluvialis]MBO0436327.1 uracil-DNA glycosylase family protein [Vagococcus fluvialis]
MNQIDFIREQIINDPTNQNFLKQGWQPVFLANPKAKIVIIGQAPGIKTQERKEVFRDKSGEKLREWMGVSEETFYESGRISVLPLDFYFPGKAKTGDLPPRKDFAAKWHPLLLKEMPDVELIILMGSYAQKYYLGKNVKKNLTETVFAYEDYLPQYFPIVHSSPLNFRWFKNNPNFEEKIVPVLRGKVNEILEN